MATSAFDGKTRVHALVEAALTAEQVDVTWGMVKNPKRSWVMVGKVDYVATEWAAIGGRKRSETYDVQLGVNVLTKGGTGKAAEDVALHLVDVVETALRANPTLDNLAVQGAALIPRTFNSAPNADGYECQWEGVVRVSGVRI